MQAKALIDTALAELTEDKSALAARNYVEKHAAAGGTKCQICTSWYRSGDNIRTVKPCNHVFHTTCVDTWYYSREPICPLCMCAHVLEIADERKAKDAKLRKKRG